LQGCRTCRRVVERATVSNAIAAEMLSDDTDCALDNWREAVIAVLDVSLAREGAARAKAVSDNAEPDSETSIDEHGLFTERRRTVQERRSRV
jgi:hypothetical protein